VSPSVGVYLLSEESYTRNIKDKKELYFFDILVIVLISSCHDLRCWMIQPCCTKYLFWSLRSHWSRKWSLNISSNYNIIMSCYFTFDISCSWSSTHSTRKGLRTLWVWLNHTISLNYFILYLIYSWTLRKYHLFFDLFLVFLLLSLHLLLLPHPEQHLLLISSFMRIDLSKLIYCLSIQLLFTTDLNIEKVFKCLKI